MVEGKKRQINNFLFCLTFTSWYKEKNRNASNNQLDSLKKRVCNFVFILKWIEVEKQKVVMTTVEQVKNQIDQLALLFYLIPHLELLPTQNCIIIWKTCRTKECEHKDLNVLSNDFKLMCSSWRTNCWMSFHLPQNSTP